MLSIDVTPSNEIKFGSEDWKKYIGTLFSKLGAKHLTNVQPILDKLEPNPTTIEQISKWEDLGNSLLHYGPGTQGTERNVQAFKCYQFAADKGSITASKMMGDCYKYGYGVERNEKKASEYSSKMPSENPQEQLKEGNRDLSENNYVKAVQYLTLAADSGNAEAQFKLANCYYLGQGVTQNYQKAVQYYERSAEQGFTNAEHALALCYYKGRGVEINFEKALFYFNSIILKEYDLGDDVLFYRTALLHQAITNRDQQIAAMVTYFKNLPTLKQESLYRQIISLKPEFGNPILLAVLADNIEVVKIFSSKMVDITKELTDRKLLENTTTGLQLTAAGKKIAEAYKMDLSSLTTNQKQLQGTSTSTYALVNNSLSTSKTSTPATVTQTISGDNKRADINVEKSKQSDIDTRFQSDQSTLGQVLRNTLGGLSLKAKEVSNNLKTAFENKNPQEVQEEKKGSAAQFDNKF